MKTDAELDRVVTDVYWMVERGQFAAAIDLLRQLERDAIDYGATKREEAKVPIDPICAIHGLKRSEHNCLFCCLCFCDLKPEDCSVDVEGNKVDVCKACAKDERHRQAYSGAEQGPTSGASEQTS